MKESEFPAPKDVVLKNINASTNNVRLRLGAAIVALLTVATLVPSIALLSSGSAFAITTPKANSTVGLDVSLSWTSVSDATSYRVQLTSTDDPTFSGPDYSLVVKGNSLTIKDAEPMAYLARVNARNSNGKRIARTPTITFTVSTNGSSPTVSTTSKPVTTVAPTTAIPSTTVAPVPTTTPGTNTGNWWKPTADKPLAFHWYLGGKVNLTNPQHLGTVDMNGATLPFPDVIDIDGEWNDASIVSAIKSKGRALGKDVKVVCYFDAGVYDGDSNSRDDRSKFPASVKGKADTGWEPDVWLDIRNIAVLEPIMKARIQRCKDRGYDAVEPDEIEGWANEVSEGGTGTGFNLTYADQLKYNRLIAKWTHEAGLSVALKGDIMQAQDLVKSSVSGGIDYFDWTLNEECNQYKECTNPWIVSTDKQVPGLQVFTQANKAVFIAEYAIGSTALAAACTTSQTNRFNTTKFKEGLPGGGRTPCAVTKWGN